MKLTEAIELIKNNDQLEKYFDEIKIDTNTPYIALYMIGKLDIDSDVRFLTRNDSNGRSEFIKDEVKYISLSSVNDIKQLVEEIKEDDEEITNQELSRKLLHYFIYDAFEE